MALTQGITYMHEHVTIDLSGTKGTDDTNLNCFDETVAEFKKLYAKGVRNMVDVTVTGMRPNPLYVQAVAEQSGINIIQATGFYTQRFFPPLVESSSVDQLAAFMVREIRAGIAGTDVRAGIIGEIGSSKDGFTPDEQKVFEAAVLAHLETGIPITTHATLGTFAYAQAVFFQERGVDTAKVLISHVDLCGDADYALRVLEQGVYVGFDTVGKENYFPDMGRVNMLQCIERAGYIDRVVLSMDITRKSNMEHTGGIGYSYLLDQFVPLLREHGIREDSIEQMLVTNPQRFFGETV
ncbi:MAG: phosphotriesterase-related protein [Oscillospiraceae bacterium]|nr:phosphotriesterase-related protein [Oscillospiraceae bacterium]